MLQFTGAKYNPELNISININYVIASMQCLQVPKVGVPKVKYSNNRFITV